MEVNIGEPTDVAKMLKNAVEKEFPSTEFACAVDPKGINICWTDGPAAFKVKIAVDECKVVGPMCRIHYQRAYSDGFIERVHALNPIATKLGVLAACKVLSIDNLPPTPTVA